MYNAGVVSWGEVLAVAGFFLKKFLEDLIKVGLIHRLSLKNGRFGSSSTEGSVHADQSVGGKIMKF
jgi:hypothetical protein